MKIYVDKIPAEGLELQEKLEPKDMPLDLETPGVSFFKPINVEAKIMKAGSQVFVNLVLEAPVEYTCGRCLSKFEAVFKKAFSLDYETKPGDIIEIGDDIRQEMMLDYPMKLLCKADCKGLCPNCGQNLNIAKCECK